jgi:hypothetical protein
MKRSAALLVVCPFGYVRQPTGTAVRLQRLGHSEPGLSCSLGPHPPTSIPTIIR